MTEEPVSSEFSRDLNLFHITMMGVGMMIGAGVFIGIGNATQIAGPGGVVMTFALNGVLAICTAMSYAELSSAVPRAGGAYNFARLAFGRGPSFLAGWMEWFASTVAGSMYALVLAIYLFRYAQGLGLGCPENLVPGVEKSIAVAAALGFLYINYRGASTTGSIGAIFALGQTLFLAIIAIAGIIVVTRNPSRLSNFRPFLPEGWSQLLVTMGLTYVAFEGYEVISQAGDETIKPRSNLPKAMLYSVLIVTFIYLGTAFAAIVAVRAGSPGVGSEPWKWIGSHGAKGFGEAVSRLNIPAGDFLLTLAVIFSATSALNATIYSAARVSFALGRDRMLPSALAHTSPKRKTPSVALLFTGILLLIVATCLPTKEVAASASMMFLLLFFLVNLSAIKIRRNMGDELTYGYLMPLFPLFPILAIVCQVVLAGWMFHGSLVAGITVPIWIFVGIAAYLFYGKSHCVATKHEIRVLEEEKAPPSERYRVLVPVERADDAIMLARNAYKLCGAKDARVDLLHMVPIPEQVSLEDAERYSLGGKEAIVEASLYLKGPFPTGTSIRYCRNIARGIVSAIREHRTDLVLMGWQGNHHTHLFKLGSTVDPLLERAPCDVVLLKGCTGNQRFRRVLVPVAGGPNAALAMEVAAIMCDPEDAELVALNVETGDSSFRAEGFIEANLPRIEMPSDSVHALTIQSTNIAETILEKAEEFDLVVMGWTRRSHLYQLYRGSVSLTVGRRCETPLALVRASGGLRSWISRWL
ncbi:MAG: amino acid permease [Planctomycetes bacterium]|nr:amino acid permease [Planctomycetota bacterium]